MLGLLTAGCQIQDGKKIPKQKTNKTFPTLQTILNCLFHAAYMVVYQ